MGTSASNDSCPGSNDPTELHNLDMQLLDKVKESGLGWTGLSANYIKAGKEKVNFGSNNNKWSTNWLTMIEFLGAYRKLMIDYLITRYIGKLQNSKAARDFYAEFMGETDFTDVIKFYALGSTNPTSDYDMTLCGPATPCIVRNIVKTFEALTHETMSFAFDSNFYIGPDILTRKYHIDQYTQRDITLFYPDGVSKEYNVAVPVPDGEIVQLERKYILQKCTPKHVEGAQHILDRYTRLFKHAKTLDRFAYRYRQNEEEIDKTAFFKLLYQMLLVSIEAYHGISTVLVVVYGMQRNLMGEVRQVLSEKCFENACLENVLDFTNHWNAYAALMSRSAESDQIVFVKLSKYLLRVLTCIEEIVIKVNAAQQLPGKLEGQRKSRASGTNDAQELLDKLHMQHIEIKSVYANRASSTRTVDVKLIDYGIHASGSINLVSRHGIGMLYDVYRYCVRQHAYDPFLQTGRRS